MSAINRSSLVLHDAHPRPRPSQFLHYLDPSLLPFLDKDLELVVSHWRIVSRRSQEKRTLPNPTFENSRSLRNNSSAPRNLMRCKPAPSTTFFLSVASPTPRPPRRSL